MPRDLTDLPSSVPVLSLCWICACTCHSLVQAKASKPGGVTEEDLASRPVMDDEAPVRDDTHPAPVSSAPTTARVKSHLSAIRARISFLTQTVFISSLPPTSLPRFQQIVVLRKSHMSLEDVQDAAEEGESKRVSQPVAAEGDCF